jgi:ribonuclease VapC
MIIDTSALLAILFDEPDGPDLLRRVVEAPLRLMSAANALEAWIVADRHANPAKAPALDALIETLSIDIEPVTIHQARVACEAYKAYGKGNHPAGLNYGDCFAYALAKAMSQPLLFKGDDFSQTDIKAVFLNGNNSHDQTGELGS